MISDLVEITDLTHDGRGVGRLQGKTCFVAGALPGESVSCRVIKQHRQYDEADLQTVVVESPSRVQPQCPYFGSCGGCQIQHLDYPAQVIAKQDRLKQALLHKQITAKNWLVPSSSNPWNYRRRARFSVSMPVKNKSELAIGFMRRASNQILPIQSCPILLDELNLLLPHLPDLLSRLSNQQRNSVSEIELSIQGGQTSICLMVERKCPTTALENPPDEMQTSDIWLKPKSSDALSIYSTRNPGDLTGPPGFMQANAEVNSAMIEKIDQLLNLTEQDILLDLFCGSGNLSFPQSRRAKQVIGIEVDQLAVQQAKSALSSDTNMDFKCADLFDADALKNFRSLFRKATAVLLDPPRAGAEAVVRELVKPKPKQIVYLSCHPATFVRDAEILVSKGYQLDSIGLLDMFPQTMHVELIAHFVI